MDCWHCNGTGKCSCTACYSTGLCIACSKKKKEEVKLPALPIPPKPESSQFDGPESRRLRERGISTAIASRHEVFELAKSIAIELGIIHRKVHMDMVQKELEERGYNSEDLGPAAGGVFRSKCWRATNEWFLSERKNNHANRLIVWEYIG